MKKLPNVCPPNIGPKSRLQRLAIGAACLVLVALIQEPILKWVLAIAGVVAIAESVLSHCFVLGFQKKVDWR